MEKKSLQIYFLSFYFNLETFKFTKVPWVNAKK